MRLNCIISSDFRVAPDILIHPTIIGAGSEDAVCKVLLPITMRLECCLSICNSPPPPPPPPPPLLKMHCLGVLNWMNTVILLCHFTLF